MLQKGVIGITNKNQVAKSINIAERYLVDTGLSLVGRTLAFSDEDCSTYEPKCVIAVGSKLHYRNGFQDYNATCYLGTTTIINFRNTSTKDLIVKIENPNNLYTYHLSVTN